MSRLSTHTVKLLHQEHGMTLRDYFAAKAMVGTASRYVYDDSRAGTWEEQLSADCYAIADAMLKERDK